MSGSAIAAYNEPQRKPLAQAKKQAALVGIKNCRNISTRELIKELRKVDANKLIDSSDGLHFWGVDPLTEYRPVIERNSKGAFLIEDPLKTLQNGNYQPVPWMTGFVENEGAVRAAGNFEVNLIEFICGRYIFVSDFKFSHSDKQNSIG